MFEDLPGKRVLITGSSSGIGAGLAEAFARHQCRMIIHCGSNRTGAESTAEKVRAHSESAIVQADLTTSAGCEKLMNEAWEIWGGFDILINNAGIVHKGSIKDTGEDAWDDTMAINLKAPYLLSRSFAKRLMDQGHPGCVLHNSSIHGSKSVEFFSAYAASKAAINSLTAVQALEWAPHGIRVNAIAPGVTPVERTEEVLSDSADLWLPYIPAGRYGSLKDLANLSIFLCSEASEWITGQVIACDGGMLSRINMPKRSQAEL